MIFNIRKWIRPEDLNPNGTLFGGSLLRWIDEEAAIYASVELKNPGVVTRFISEINFISSATLGDIIEMGLITVEYGRTSVTLHCEVRNMISRKQILVIDKIVFVNVDTSGNPLPHGMSSSIKKIN